MKVRFWFRKQQSKENSRHGILYATVTIHQKRSQPFSTGISVLASEWDSKTQRITAQAKAAYNEELANIRSALLSIKNNLQSQRQDITAERVRAEWMKLQTPPQTIVSLIDMHIDYQKKYGIGRHGKQLTSGTMQTYITYKTYLLDYLDNHKSANTTAQEINAQWLNHYQAYSLNRLTQHSINLSIYYIKQVLRFAIANEIITKAPALQYKMKPSVKPMPNPLTPNDIHKLETTSFTRAQQRAVHCFLFMRYTGLHYIDARNLKPENLKVDANGRYFLHIIRQKTNEPALIPFHPKAEQLVTLYGGLAQMPFTDYNNIRRHLKDVAKVAGINKPFALGSARDTFADDCSNNMGVSDETLAAMLGHTSINYVKKYRRINIDRIVKEWKV